MFDRLSISRPWKKPARSCASVKPKISDAWNRWSAGLSCATLWSYVHGCITLELAEHFAEFDNPVAQGCSRWV
jgi:hypothetical protein